MPAFTPANPDYGSRVRESFGRQAFMDLLGGSVDDVSPGACTLKTQHASELDKHAHGFHSGVIASLADTAAGYAAFSLAPDDASILTVEFKINFLSGASGDYLIAEAEVIQAGQQLTVCEARVYAETAGQRTLCAVVLETLIFLPGRADSQESGRPATQRRSSYQADEARPRVQPGVHDFADFVSSELADDQFAVRLGLRLASIEPGHAVCEVPHRTELTQQHGFFHGGMVATMADTAMAVAAGSLVLPGSTPLTVEYKLNLMAPGDGRSLKAYGYVVRPGRTLSICRADVTTVDAAGQEHLCASAMGTLVPVAA